MFLVLRIRRQLDKEEAEWRGRGDAALADGPHDGQRDNKPDPRNGRKDGATQTMKRDESKSSDKTAIPLQYPIRAGTATSPSLANTCPSDSTVLPNVQVYVWVQ